MNSEHGDVKENQYGKGNYHKDENDVEHYDGVITGNSFDKNQRVRQDSKGESIFNMMM